MRYWLRWTVEPELRWPLVPAVLNSLDGYSLMPMEFPLLNLIGAPFFALGATSGRNVAMLFVFSLYFVLTLLCVRTWQGKKVLNSEADRAFLLLPLIGISSTFIAKFMPDYLSMILVLWGVGLIWNDKVRPARMAASLVLMTLGLLVKPTAVTVFLLLLMRDVNWISKFTRSLWVIPSLLLAGLYYTVGLKWIASLQDTPGLFAVQARAPLDSVVEFFAEPKQVLRFLMKDLGIGGLPVIYGCVLWLCSAEARKQLLLLGLAFALQIIAIAALDGSHSFIHSYYHIGTSPLIALGFWLALTELKHNAEATKVIGKRIMIGVLMLAAGAQIFDTMFFELRSLSSKREHKYVWPNEIDTLKARNPDFPWGRGYTFRASRALAYPNLGILFGEREGSSTAEYGFYLKTDPPPAGCSVVDDSKSVALVHCVSKVN
jgi:hypothetical protein